MTRNRLLATGIVGFLVSMLGCVTPILIALLAALGISGSMGWLDYILLPAMAIFAGLAVYKRTAIEIASVPFGRLAMTRHRGPGGL